MADKVRPIDGKFGVSGSKLVNLVSGEEIPEDEPLFLLRARDHHAAELLMTYLDICKYDCNDLHQAGIWQVRERFVKFAAEHPERMKQPGVTKHLKLEPEPSSPSVAQEKAARELLRAIDANVALEGRTSNNIETAAEKLRAALAPTQPSCHVCGNPMTRYFRCGKCQATTEASEPQQEELARRIAEARIGGLREAAHIAQKEQCGWTGVDDALDGIWRNGFSMARAQIAAAIEQKVSRD